MFTRSYWPGNYWTARYWVAGGSPVRRVVSFSVRRGFEGPQNVIDWVPPNDDEAVELRIVRKVGGYPERVDDGVILVTDTAPFSQYSYSDRNVQHGVVYYYKLFVRS